MAERVDVARILSGLYLPETTFAQEAVKLDSKTALVTHTLTKAQCALRKTEMLRGIIGINGDTVTNTRLVDNEITEGHFTKFKLLAGHQGFGMLLSAGMYDRPMWWTGVGFISFQSPAAPNDEMVATATISKDTETVRIFDGNVKRGRNTHTRAGDIQLEPSLPDEFKGFHLPQNAWLEVGAHLGGGAIAALGEFPGDDFAPFYLGVSQSTFPKELGRPGDELSGTVTINSIEEMEISGLGELKVISVDEVISKGTSERWSFTELEFGFLPKEQLMEAIRKR